ncbi:MAG: Hsp20/alpha crystallin family protein [Myxococcota bacterium]|nr:Hsp20/alpha crystallin family protein [Myxococcota bacterium]
MSKGTSLKKQEPKAQQITQADTHVQIEPRVDIFENDNEILLVADMPGVEPSALDVRLDTPQLTIQGRQSVPATEQASLSPLFFERSFRVPPSIDANGVKAELKKGVLKIRLEKSEKVRPKKIQVRAI